MWLYLPEKLQTHEHDTRLRTLDLFAGCGGSLRGAGERKQMGADTKIEWCDHTFNPWRERDSEVAWRVPMKWNRDAERTGDRARVFCASLADVCEDRDELAGPRDRLKRLIKATPHLDWLLLSKRPENYLRMFWPWPEWWPLNVWCGASAENQDTLDERLPHLVRVPALVRFLSLEPLLGPIDLRGKLRDTNLGACSGCAPHRRGDTGATHQECTHEHPGRGIDWIIVGGESGSRARPCNVAWVRSIVRQCREAGAACFVKQLGANVLAECCGMDGSQWPPGTMIRNDIDVIPEANGVTALATFRLRDPKGGDPSEWPEDLRVREWPK